MTKTEVRRLALAFYRTRRELLQCYPSGPRNIAISRALALMEGQLEWSIFHGCTHDDTLNGTGKAKISREELRDLMRHGLIPSTPER